MGGVGGWRLTVKESETGACETDSSDEKRLRDRELDQWHGGEGEKWRRLRNSGRDWQRFSVHHVVCAFFLFLQRGRVWPNVTAPFCLESPELQLLRPPQDHRARLGNNANTHTHTHIYTTVFLDNLLDLSHSLSRSATSQFWHFLTLLYPHPSLAASKGDITVKRTITCQRCYPPRETRDNFSILDRPPLLLDEPPA